ncbi:MAG: HD domain-containing protein [Planctomycetes bacterium]|nr:HD domain-containing protein [Planctomycetota bacterium]
MENLLKFLFEVGKLKKVKRSGWWLIGVDLPESVADHSFRCAAIGYFLAKLEKADPYRVAVMCLFHDIQETRINDLHRVGQRYIDPDLAEKKAFAEQIESLSEELGSELRPLLVLFGNKDSLEGTLAKDADILECALQAREYQHEGFVGADDWLKNAKGTLVSKSAQKLLKLLETANPDKWWKLLKLPLKRRTNNKRKGRT